MERHPDMIASAFHSTFVLLLSLQLCVHSGLAQDCLRPNGDTQIPVEDTSGPVLPNNTQVIITSYQFHCCGDIEEWGAAVSPNNGANRNGRYTIHFQVWRPSPTVDIDGCYSLVGENRFTSITFSNDVVSETPQPSNVLSVRPGDVLGYLSLTNGDVVEQGVQLHNNNENLEAETVWYHTGTPTSPLVMGQRCCPLAVGSGENRMLISSTNLGPIVSASVVSSDCTQLPSSSCMTMSQETTSSQVTSTAVLSSTPPPLPFSTLPLPFSTLPNVPASTPMLVSFTTSAATSTSQALDTVDSISPGEPSSTEEGTEQVGTNKLPGEPNIAGLAVGLVVLALIFVVCSVIIVAVLIYKWKKDAYNKDNAVTNPYYCYATHQGLDSAKKPQTEDMRYVSSIDYSLVGGDTSDPHYATPNVNMVKKTATNETVKTSNHLGQSRIVCTQKKDLGKDSAMELKTLPRMDLITSDHYHLLGPEYADPNLGSVDPIYESCFNESMKVSENTAFGSAGHVVPKQGEQRRISDPEHYKPEVYNKLEFDRDDLTYWSPASTASEIYDQLSSNKFREITRTQLTVLEHLGSGQFGTVSKGLWTVSKDSIVIAVKQLHPNATTIERVKLLQEAAIMGQFCHPNVVKFHGLVTIREPIMVCIEYMKNGDLKSFVGNMDVKESLSAEIKDVRVFFVKAAKEIAAGMRYLSKKSFVHRDLAARNVLIDDFFICKVGDFGMARDLVDDTYYTAQSESKIPVKWTAPEALLYKKYSSDSDVYSYGMVLFEIWSVGKKPFPSMSNQEVIRTTQMGCVQSPPPGCPRAFYKLMVDCWNPNHQYRPKFTEICNYLQQPISKLQYWSPLDSASLPEAEELGGALKYGFSLYMDLQTKHRKS